MTGSEIQVGPDDWAEAIARASGHQIVVAGPGTGKTEFLVRRVHYLVDKGLARRDQIAVVCFSRRAAADLRQRIQSRLGGAGTQVDATTFHSLALRLMEAANPGNRPVLLTTPEQVGVVRAVLADEDPSDWPITYRGILTTDAFADEVADFLMRCSERLLSPTDLAEKARERADWRGLPDLYARYLERLVAMQRTDYGVLLRSAVDLLETDAGQELASHYRFVLVDEYQDTSPAQAKLAKLLATPSGNLTVTGDPYQSIYSFRGAELRNVSEFHLSGPDTERIVLTQSFRVPEEIMTSALRVVSPGHLPGEAGRVTPAAHSGRVEAYLFDQETAEAEWIAREVERAIQVEDVEPSAIAVLVRTKKELVSELSRALQRRGVPHDPPSTRLVDHPAARLIHDLVTVAMDGGSLGDYPASRAAEADRAMRRVLLGPLVGISLSGERQLLRRRRSTGEGWARILARNHPSLSELLNDREWATALPASDGFWELWSGLSLIGKLANDPTRASWRRAWTALAQVLATQSDRDPSVTLHHFFDLVAGGDYEASPLLSYQESGAGVTLTTMHQAKGLEFDVVFIANAVEGVFPDLRRSRRMLRPELLSPERTTDAHAQHLFRLQEEMRLAYTATTRARRRVVWTATDAGVDQGEHRPSRFLTAAAGVESLAELTSPGEDRGEPVTLNGAEISLRRDLTDPSTPPVTRLVAAQVLANPEGDWWDQSFFAGLAETGPDAPILGGPLRLSPSQADSYATCPRRYALERRLRLGDASSPWAHFGSLVHEALEMAERQVVGTGRPHAVLEDAVNAIDSVWESADFGTPELNRAWREQAVSCVANLYEKWPHADGEPIELESLVTGEIAGVEWMGKIDRLERTDAGLRVVDYKTSKSVATIAEAETSIQLAFYAMAVSMTEDVVAAEMWYPRVASRNLTTRSLDMNKLADVVAVMEEITESIQAEHWEPRPGKHCDRCQFRGSCPAWPEGRGAYLS
ncbi:MAG: ATP-dependent DNA helicase [Acidimicrobiia bacterium]|nr:ATP-dependent DNA helicase [Acidimicrobiia bacterium]